MAPHIVVFPWPAQGHINPALQFSHYLASRGLSITFVNTAHNISKMQAQAHQFIDSGLHIRLVGLPDGLPEGEGGTDDLPRLCAATEKMDGVLEELLVKLLKDGQDWPPPVCIVTDVFLGWAQDVADKLKLPRFILFTPPAATLVLMLHVPDMISKGRLPYQSEGKHAELLDLPGLTPKMRLSDIPSHLLLDPSAFMYGYFIRHSRRLPDAAGILLNTFYELESQAIDAARAFLQSSSPVFSLRSEAMAKIEEQMLRRVMPVGPLLPSDFFDGSNKSSISRTRGPEDDLCLNWLSKQRPSSVLYVSFGSIAVLSDAQIHELALGLEASEQPFLWVVRPQNPTATHEDVLPPAFTTRTKGQGLVISWAPQLEVVSHESTGFFLSHCGWNSTLESICSGVAMLAWPMFAEQKMNGRFLVDEAKVALEFGRGEDGMVGREEVERVVRLAMEGEEGLAMKARVREHREIARKALLRGGSSCNNVDAFVEVVSTL